MFSIISKAQIKKEVFDDIKYIENKLFIEDKKYPVSEIIGFSLLVIDFSTILFSHELGIEDDKQLHLTAGFVGGGGIMLFLYQQTENKFWSFIGANVSMFCIGWLKENYDYNNRGIFSNSDLTYTFAGSFMSTIPLRFVFGGKNCIKKSEIYKAL